MSNPFRSLLTDKVSILKSDGTEIGPYDCAFDGSSCTIFDESIDVDEGDVVLRNLPNGKVETHKALDVEYTAKFHAIPASYKLTLEKPSSLLPRRKGDTVVNITQSHGIQVGDHNSLAITSGLDSLITEIDKSTTDLQEKKSAKDALANLLRHPIVVAVVGKSIDALVKRLS
ncbi:MAG: hypothetical protein KME02_04355 [Aphanothece saxicola GSE-SYN-MK-01-06B]|jgi:hypothetical protein|nr:hypothetical protein [Aphanothece saxicola GSE-SYN-MK-01-06B]